MVSSVKAATNNKVEVKYNLGGEDLRQWSGVVLAKDIAEPKERDAWGFDIKLHFADGQVKYESWVVRCGSEPGCNTKENAVKLLMQRAAKTKAAVCEIFDVTKPPTLQTIAAVERLNIMLRQDAHATSQLKRD